MTSEQFENWQWIMSRADSDEELAALQEMYEEELKQDPFYN